MRAASAIAWERYARHRVGFIAVAAYAPAIVCLRALGVPAALTPDRELWFAFTVIVPFSVCLFFLLVGFTYGADGNLAARASLFPARLLALPIRTTTLVAWPMLYAALVMAALWTVTWLAALRPAGVELPFVWPGLLLIVFIAWMQALTWMPYGLRGLRVILALLWLTIGDIVGVLALELHASETLMLAVLAPQIPLAFLAARHAVARARRGDAPDWLGALRRRHGAGVHRARRPPFANAARAQLWFEWRQHGWALPRLVAILLPFELMVLLAARDAPALVYTLVLMAALTPLVMAPFVAATVRKSGPGATDAHRLTPFQATRPLSSRALIATKLAVTAISTVLALLTVLAAIPAALALSDTGHIVRAAWDAVRRAVGDARALFLVVGSVGGLALLTWKQLVQSLYVGLRGRPGLVRLHMAVMLALLFAVLPVFDWVRQHQSVLVTLWHILPWLVALAAVVKLGAASWIAIRLERTGLLPGHALLIGAALWLLVVTILYAALVWFFDTPFVPRAILLLAAVLAVPLARLSAAPLALARNRHQ